ncbi:MAG: TrmH family RNA methyltransferase [Bacillota bacterium]|jgi:TrmH family RNA methyltransferase
MDVPWRLISSLQAKKERTKSRLTVAEGPPSVLLGLLSQAVFEFLILDTEMEATARGREIREALAQHPKPGKVLTVKPSLYRKMSGTKTPQGALLVLPFPFEFVSPLPKSPWLEPLSVVGVDLQDPGNAGTLIRNAASVGAWEVSFTGDAVDPYSPKCIRASAGAVFQVPVTYHKDPVLYIRDLLDTGSTVYKTLPEGGIVPWEARLDKGCALVLGNEGQGLPWKVDSLITQAISIPMPGGTQSLNVAAASAVVLYEAARQRMTCPSQ